MLKWFLEYFLSDKLSLILFKLSYFIQMFRTLDIDSESNLNVVLFRWVNLYQQYFMTTPNLYWYHFIHIRKLRHLRQVCRSKAQAQLQLYVWPKSTSVDLNWVILWCVAYVWLSCSLYWPEASVGQKLTLSCRFRCDQIKNKHCYKFWQTLSCCLSPT